MPKSSRPGQEPAADGATHSATVSFLRLLAVAIATVDSYPLAENAGSSYLMLFQRGGWLRELEHLPDDGDPPQTIYPRTIAPEDWEEDPDNA